MEVLTHVAPEEIERGGHDLQEAFRAGLENAQRFINILLQHPQQQHLQRDCDSDAFQAVTNFRKVVSLLSRNGHARFRKGPKGSQNFSLAEFSDSFRNAFDRFELDYCYHPTPLIPSTYAHISEFSQLQQAYWRMPFQGSLTVGENSSAIELAALQQLQQQYANFQILPAGISVGKPGLNATSISASKSFFSSLSADGCLASEKPATFHQPLPPLWSRHKKNMTRIHMENLSNSLY